MSKKHYIIKDADEDVEYDVEEVTEAEEPEKPEEEVIEEHKEEVCPECGKDPCECKSAEKAVFSEEEVAALKELISIVPELKKLLEAKLEEPKEQEEIKEIEEVKTDTEEKPSEEEEIEEDESEEELDDSVADSIGSIELMVGDSKDDEVNSTEAAMAERFKKYYGGN
jgi:hypothetical protein